MIARVALAGPMGAGKTTVGRVLAERLSARFVDLDAEVGDIPAIFAEEGEAGFRARERAALARVVADAGAMVLALGGGTVVAPENRVLLDGWRVFVLTAPVSVLRSRIGPDPRRPLLPRLDQLVRDRADAYAQAGELVPTAGLEPWEIADRIVAKL